METGYLRGYTGPIFAKFSGLVDMGLDDQSGIRSVCDRSRDVAVVTVFGSNRQRLAYLTFIIRTGIAKQTEGSQRL